MIKEIEFYICKYCRKKYLQIDEYQMHVLNCKKNPDMRKHNIKKNDYIFPVNHLGIGDKK